MAPRIKITREIIIEAATDIISEKGYQSITVRELARTLNCSTQPILYWFKTMDELKQTLYEHIARLHNEFLLNTPEGEDRLIFMGLRHIGFALDHPNWFRFLSQSGYGKKPKLIEVPSSADFKPFIDVIMQETGLNRRRAKEVYMIIAPFVHGYASLVIGNSIEYIEEDAFRHIKMTFTGAMAAVMND